MKFRFSIFTSSPLSIRTLFECPSRDWKLTNETLTRGFDQTIWPANWWEDLNALWLTMGRWLIVQFACFRIRIDNPGAEYTNPPQTAVNIVPCALYDTRGWPLITILGFPLEWLQKTVHCMRVMSFPTAIQGVKWGQVSNYALVHTMLRLVLLTVSFWTYECDSISRTFFPAHIGLRSVRTSKSFFPCIFPSDSSIKLTRSEIHLIIPVWRGAFLNRSQVSINSLNSSYNVVNF